MAFSDVIPKVFSARALEYAYENVPWLSVVDDRSSELSGSGNAISVPNLKTTTTVTAYDETGSDAVAYQAMTPDDIDININKKWYAAYKVEDIQERQTVVNIMNSAQRQSNEALALKLTADLRAIFKAGVKSANKTSISHTVAQWGTAANQDDYRLELFEAFMTVVQAAKEAGWHTIGSVFAVIPPEIETRLMKYFLIDKPNFGMGSTVDSMARNAQLSSLLGLNVIVDTTITGSLASAGTVILPSYFGVMGSSMAYAGQMRVSETIRSEDRFADLFRVLYTYGATVVNTDFARELSLTATS